MSTEPQYIRCNSNCRWGRIAPPYAEGNSLIEGANHIREGIVVRPIIDRFTYEIGRLQLKIISNAYLEGE